jgi:putative lipoprotein
MITAVALSLVLVAPASSQAPIPAPDPPRHEGEWVVEVIDNIKVMPEARVTLRVQANTVSGLASCNSYRGGVQIVGERIKVGEIMTTMKACDGPRMSEERDFLALLKTVVRLQLRDDDTLLLTNPEGKTITATRAKGSSIAR